MKNKKSDGVIRFDEKKFLKELSDVVKKHNLKNCVFAGENEDDKMVGLFSFENYGGSHSAKSIIDASLNAARLYQASREKIFYTLDKYFK